MAVEDTWIMNEPEHPSGTGHFPEIRGLRLLHELGRSPKGVTYKARRLVEQDVVAAKILRPSRCEKTFIAELPRKAEATFVLEHKGLVRSLGCVDEDGRLVLLMDYAHGEPLAKALQQGKPFPVPRALLIGIQCAKALHYAALHKLHHGRLHPGDIILGEDHARITGVGLGQRPEHAAWSEPEAPFFEPLVYTAPEALPSKPLPETPAARAAADVYSLGAIVFHLLTGSPPFHGTDEGALELERKAISGPVLWPPEKKTGLPPEAVVLVCNMLAPGAQARPGYEEVAAVLSRALAAVEKAEAAKLAVANSGLPHSGLRGGVRAAVTATPPRQAAVTGPSAAGGLPVGAAPPAGAAWGYVLPPPARPPLLNRIYTGLLVGLTAVVFIVAIGLAAKIFVLDALRQPPTVVIAQPAAAPPPAAPAPATAPQKTAPATAAAPGTVPEPERKSDEAAAARQLEVIQDLLARKELKPNAGVVKVLKEIADKAGRDTPAGLKAAILAAEVDDTLNRPAAPKPPEPAPAAKTETPMPPPTAEAPAIPGVGRAGGAQPEKPPAPEAPAKTAETPPKAPPAEPAAPAAPSKLSVALRSLAPKVKACLYGELNGDLARLSGGVEGDDKAALDIYVALQKREQDLFKRCRKWLVDEIQRRPRHDSPLQVFPRKNEPGDDIVDFDEAGLKIVEKRATGTNIRTLGWEKTPPAQAFALMQLTADKNGVEDHLGLAVFASNRGLKNETEQSLAAARALPSGREKGAAVEDQLKQIAKVMEGAAGAEKR